MKADAFLAFNIWHLYCIIKEGCTLEMAYYTSQPEEVVIVQKCQKCFESFSWKSMIKFWLFGNKVIKCSSCNSEHYASGITGFGYGIFAFTIPMIIVLVLINTKAINIFNIFWGYLLAHLLWIILITLGMPFFAHYHIREARKIEC